MSVVIDLPEIETLLRQHMVTRAFQDVEEVLIHALRFATNVEGVPSSHIAGSKPGAVHSHVDEAPFGKKLVASLAEARGILDGAELDIRRDPHPGRAVDVS